MKIAIISASGFLGKKLFRYLSKNHEVIGTYFKKKEKGLHYLDATKFENVKDFLLKHKPDVVIDTIALTSSVVCEKNPEQCKLLNYTTAENIAKSCEKINAKMVFISSSYIFDGKKGDYTEEDKFSPENEYAKNKILAEKEVLTLKDSIVIRTEPMYGYDESINQIKFGTGTFEREVIEVGYTDLLRNQIFINDVPKIISELLEKNESGIFNIGSPEKINFLDFLKKLALLVNAENKIKIVDSSNWIVKSPKDSSLNISKINSLGIKTTSFETALEIIKKSINH
jgi:dTDP-4-dehydrorhamnose reductase|tara:strand:+ start:2369 stop:3220 length:852 start_codon:yes stop_codon:yes gene_type:complete